MVSELQFQWLPAHHVQRAHEIEEKSFPADEAANLQAFRDRQKLTPPLFLGAYIGEPSETTLIGYVCSTRSSAESLTHDSMSRHEEKGTSVCIHSVCVDVPYRRKGVALKILEEYSKRLSEDPSIHRLLLIAHEELVQLYERAGFEYRGKSSVEHGSRLWFELRQILRQEPPSVSPALLQALSRPSEPKSKVDFAQIDQNNLETGNSTNPYDLICPRLNCGSVILKKGVGKFHSKPAIDEIESLSVQHPFLAPLPASPVDVPWWLITPSPMEFENIAFSRPTKTANSISTGKPVKFLACADCDIGPLGWCYEGSTEFWLAASRVTYRQHLKC